MIAQVFVYKQCIERRRIKPCKKHTYNDYKINFLAFYSFGEVTIIVLKFFTINAITGFEHSIIVIDSFS